MQTLDIATFSHIGGQKRQLDSSVIWSNNQKRTHLIIIADGSGLNESGGDASQAVIECAKDHWINSKETFTSPENDLAAIAWSAQNTITRLATNKKTTPASSIIALYIDEHQQTAHWIHCGNSRLYRIRKGQEISRTRDLADSPPPLGSSDYKGVNYKSCSYLSRDVFMLCSDGYWQSLLSDAKTLPPKPVNLTLAQFTKKIVGDAVARNGKKSDNVSLTIAYINPGQDDENQDEPVKELTAPQSTPIKTTEKDHSEPEDPSENPAVTTQITPPEPRSSRALFYAFIIIVAIQIALGIYLLASK